MSRQHMDFKKKFDRVPHNRPIWKLEYKGVQGKYISLAEKLPQGYENENSINGNILILERSNERCTTGLSVGTSYVLGVQVKLGVYAEAARGLGAHLRDIGP